MLCSQGQNAEGLRGDTGQKSTFKGIFHPRMKMLSSFIHPQVVPDLYKCISSAEHILLVMCKNVDNQTGVGTHWLPQ